MYFSEQNEQAQSSFQTVYLFIILGSNNYGLMIFVTDWPILQSINLGCDGGREDKYLIVNKQSQLERHLLKENLRTFGLSMNFFRLYKPTGLLLGCSCPLARLKDILFGISPMFMGKVIYLNTSQHLSCSLYNSKQPLAPTRFL